MDEKAFTPPRDYPGSDLHKPIRTCIACGKKTDKSTLLRIVRTPRGAVRIDLEQRFDGRGAYICKRVACVTKATQKKALTRHLSVTTTSEFEKKIRAALDEPTS